MIRRYEQLSQNQYIKLHNQYTGTRNVAFEKFRKQPAAQIDERVKRKRAAKKSNTAYAHIGRYMNLKKIYDFFVYFAGRGKNKRFAVNASIICHPSAHSSDQVQIRKKYNTLPWHPHHPILGDIHHFE